MNQSNLIMFHQSLLIQIISLTLIHQPSSPVQYNLFFRRLTMINIQNMNPSPSTSSITSFSTVRNKIFRKTDPNFRDYRSRSKSRGKSFEASFQDYCNRHLNQKTPKNTKFSEMYLPNESINSESIIDDAHQNSGLLSIHNQAHKKRRKREPTPIKSRRQLSQSEPVNLSPDNRSMGTEATLMTLQQDLKAQILVSQRTEEANEDLKNQLHHTKTEMMKLQQTNFIFQMQNQRHIEKIQYLENIIQESENNLADATNALKKLKEKIRENRIQELQTQNQELRGSINELHQEIKAKNLQIEKLSESLNIVQQEMEALRRNEREVRESEKTIEARERYLFDKINTLRIEMNETQREWQPQYQQILQEKDRRIERLLAKLEKQKLRRHNLQYYSYSFEEKLKKIKQDNELQIKEIRIRYSKTIQDLRKKIQKDENKKKTTPAFMNKRKGIIDKWNTRAKESDSDTQITLELSPQ